MIGTLLLNRYELLEKIGEGGMGIVYKAKCHLLNRFVAVKILKAELSNDESFVKRFKREGTSVASLSHPNIVNVYDIGEENHINFIVMEYINGKTLKQVIKDKGRLSSEKTLEIALQIAKALECAHKNNIIHRDIKPDNILITLDSIAKVTDFGIAKIADAGTITNSNKIIGSVHYFSPEQARGGFVDFRTDIYSLGIVMYEMITGRVPFDSENSISVAIMHIQEPIISPNKIITDIPKNINQVILKSLEKDPINRYQSAREMIEILNAIKENCNFKVNLINRSMDATKVIVPIVVSDTGNDLKTVITQVVETKNQAIKFDTKVLLRKKATSKNKKIMIIIGLIILVMIIGISGKYLFKKPSTDIKANLSKATIPKAAVPEKSVKLPIDEKKLVPSLIGNTQDIAKHTIVSNGFLLGAITNDFSDSIANGLVISQSPMMNTSYEISGKINFVISEGKKIIPVTVPAPQSEAKGRGKRVKKK